MEGRKYHDVEGSSYCLSTDDKELDRIVVQHYLMKDIFGGNFSAPVREILELDAKVLDVGCSSASWAMEMATDFPKSKVIGIDMVPVFPTTVKPDNCNFTLANILHGLPFMDNTFDLISMRFFVFALRKEEWQVVLRELKRVCRVGGYCEFLEGDIVPHRIGPLGHSVCEKITMASEARGQYADVARHLKGMIEEAGLEDVDSTMMSCPIGKWGGRIGDIGRENVETGIASGKGLWTTAWGWTGDQFDERLAELVKECDRYKGYINYYRVWGQKVE
jgi:SAM-dependent methyltransferase